MARLQHSGGAVPTTLTNPMTDVDVSPFDVDAVTGWPDGSVGPFYVVIDRGLLSEEKLLVASRAGNTLTLGARAADGTTAQPHAAGAVIEHTFSAVEADEANAHIEANDAVHGVGVGEVIATESSVAAAITAAHPQDYAEDEATVAGTTDPTLTTTVHSLPYPAPTDDLLVRRALQLLAEALDVKVPIILHGTGVPPEPAGDYPEGTVYHRTEA